MKKCLLILLTAVTLLFTGCIKDAQSEYPMLKVINVGCNTITNVSLTGYSFGLLQIESGQSQTFTLTNGMNAGYTNIPVYVSDGMHAAVSGKFNFENGKVTVIHVDKCSTSQAPSIVY